MKKQHKCEPPCKIDAGGTVMLFSAFYIRYSYIMLLHDHPNCDCMFTPGADYLTKFLTGHHNLNGAPTSCQFHCSKSVKTGPFN